MFTEDDFKVVLNNKEEVKNFIRKHGEFASVCYNTPRDKGEQVGLHCLLSGHMSGSRHLYFDFSLECIPRFTIDQLVRHEKGIVKNVQSLRYVNKENGFSIYCPPEMRSTLELLEQFARTQDYLSRCYEMNIFELTNTMYHTQPVASQERANECARTFIPIGIASSCNFACNLEGLMHIANVRLCTRAELPIRKLVEKMVAEVVEVEPRYKELLVPQCEILGRCPELKGCGRYEKR